MASAVRSLIRAAIQLAFSPVSIGALLAAFAYAPAEVHAIIDKFPSGIKIDPNALKTALRAVLALQITRIASRTLSTSAANQWRFTSQPGWDWPAEIALVTGGCSGIGEKLVHGLVGRGMTVVVLDIQALPANLEENKRVRYYRCDITNPESVAAVAEAVRADVGHPSILINNAGIHNELGILKTPAASIQRTFGVNTVSHWFLTQQFVPQMVQVNKGHVVTIASMASFVALPHGSAYAASKASALAFHEALTCELRHLYKAPGVVTTVVHPNFVQTPLTAPIADKLTRGGATFLTSDEVAKQVLLQIDRKRGGQIFIPAYNSLASGIRGWPTWVQELFRDAIGRGAAKF